MTNIEKVYTGLCVLFSVLVVLGNLIYCKFVIVSIPFFYAFELSAGAILYPLTFLITDLVAEFYGKERAKFCVRLAIAINIVVAFVIASIDSLPTVPWSKIDHSTFHRVFGLYHVAFISSIFSCYISQVIDIALYLWIRKLTKGRYLWARNTGSTAISLFIDTSIVVFLITMFGALPKEHMWQLIISSYSWKLFFLVSSTPLFYVCFRIINYIHKG